MEWEQERHDLKRQLSTVQASHKYLQEEFEIVQKEVEEKKNNIQHLTKLIKDQKELNVQSALEWKTKLENLEKQKEEKEKKHLMVIAKLKEEINNLKTEQDSEQINYLSDVQILQNERKTFEHDFELLKSEYERVFQEKMQLIKENKKNIEEKEEINNILLCKQGELATYIERCTGLQEEVILLKIENDSFKAAPPSHSDKGNSVFAEVDDNRKALKKNLDKLAEKYNILKRDFKCKSIEILKLRAEKSSLLKKVNEISCKFENNESNRMENYKTRVKDLESFVQDLKQEKENQPQLSGEMKVIDGIFAFKNKKIETLQERVEKLSSTVFVQNDIIYTLKRDLLIEANKSAYELSEKMRLQEELNNAKSSIEN